MKGSKHTAETSVGRPRPPAAGALYIDDLRTDVPNGSTRPPRRDKRSYSRITNGKAFLPHVHGNSPWVRRCKDLYSLHLADAGGYENTSEAERLRFKFASVIEVELENMATRFGTMGQASPEELDLFQRTASGWRRLWDGVGMQRVPRDVSPNLKQFVEARAATIEAEVNDGDGEA